MPAKIDESITFTTPDGRLNKGYAKDINEEGFLLLSLVAYQGNTDIVVTLELDLDGNRVAQSVSALISRPARGQGPLRGYQVKFSSALPQMVKKVLTGEEVDVAAEAVEKPKPPAVEVEPEPAPKPTPKEQKRIETQPEYFPPPTSQRSQTSLYVWSLIFLVILAGVFTGKILKSGKADRLQKALPAELQVQKVKTGPSMIEVWVANEWASENNHEVRETHLRALAEQLRNTNYNGAYILNESRQSVGKVSIADGRQAKNDRIQILSSDS